MEKNHKKITVFMLILIEIKRTEVNGKKEVTVETFEGEEVDRLLTNHEK